MEDLDGWLAGVQAVNLKVGKKLHIDTSLREHHSSIQHPAKVQSCQAQVNLAAAGSVAWKLSDEQCLAHQQRAIVPCRLAAMLKARLLQLHLQFLHA